MTLRPVDDADKSTISGSAIVVGLFALALVLALIAWFYASMSNRRSMEAWGADQAALIATAPTAELWTLSADESASDGADNSERIEVDGSTYTVVARRDITSARGVLHLRRGLVDDTSFDWQQVSDDCQPRWTHALSFADGTRRATLLVSLDCPRVRLLANGRQLSTEPIATAVREFVAEETGE